MTFGACVVALGVGLALTPLHTLRAIIGAVTALYVVTVIYRLRTFFRSLGEASMLRIPDDEARAMSDQELPVYTVLVPLYKEPEVLDQLLAALDELEYPRDRLDIKLLVEADDPETIRAAGRQPARPHLDVVVVPPGEPRTKPRALNYGFLTARGQLVTIYDAEDRPEPLQLRRAVAAFHKSEASVGCLQAKLSFYNRGQNLLTRWFALEYVMWFSYFLPALQRRGDLLPLGGTSSHFRRELLEEVNGWDPFNVTEDADLGVRLRRFRWRSVVLDSTTYEEANSDFVNWMKQRSRWQKGYLQTWLVHLRRPIRTWKQLRPGFLSFNLLVGGTPILALVNPVFWGMTLLWFVGHPGFLLELFPSWLYYAALFSWLFGNSAVIYTAMIAARESRLPELLPAALLFPVYWLMMSIATVKAVLQLPRASALWEKTTHGLFVPRSA